MSMAMFLSRISPIQHYFLDIRMIMQGRSTRIYFVLAFCLLGAFLHGIPVLESALNTNVYHASSSDTHCVTAFYDPTDLGTALNYMTLWNVEDPAHPIAGTTIYESQWSGMVAYRQPTVYKHYLLYMDSFHLHILDITNINSPTQVFQQLLGQIYCFTVMDDYLITGSQDGILTVFDITEPQLPVQLSSTASMPAIWMLWPCGNLLAVRCGNYSNNTAKLFGFSSGTLSELASVTPGGQISYVGAWNARLVVQNSSGSILMYEYSSGNEPVPIADIAVSNQTQKIISDGTFLVSTGEDNCVRIWQWDPSNGLHIAGYYDLGHLGLDPGTLCELKDGHLLYTLDAVLCLLLDINDPAQDPALLHSYTDGSSYRSMAIPEHGNTIYCEKNNTLNTLRVTPDGQIIPDSEIPWTGVVINVENYRDNLYYLSSQDNAYRLKGLNVSNPSVPLSFVNMPLESDQLYNMKDRHIYSGTLSNVNVYKLNDSGIPEWQRQLSYIEPHWNYQVYFYDIASSADTDYAVGVFGNWFDGYHPILVYWLPDGTSGSYNLGKFYDKLYVCGDYLYLLGWGIQVYQINTTRLPLFVGEHYASDMNYGLESSLVLADRFLVVNHSLTNSISIYDLQNPQIPQLAHTIHQTHRSYELGSIGNKLISACGVYGISAYSIQGMVDIPDELAPAIPRITAYPNPFSAQVTLSFEMKNPEPVSLKCYNIRGQLVYTQTISHTRTGINTAEWDGRDINGRQCPSGVYILKLSTSHDTAVTKLTRFIGY